MGGTFIECGAFDGQTECSCKFFEETMGWTGINLEPVPRLYEKLTKNRPSSTNLNLGLSDSTRSVKFQTVEHPHYGVDTTIGAIEHNAAFKDSLLADGCVFHDIEVKVISWRDLLLKTGITCVDLMVLDVEGHELAVLAGMKGSSVLPHIMCVEFGHIGFDRIRLEMSELGYEYDITSYANAFFIRRDMIQLFAFRRHKPTATSTVTVGEAERLRGELSAMKLSTSWRITAPLRALKSILKRP